MTNLELVNLMKLKIKKFNENPQIAHWIFYHYNNIDSLEEYLSICNNISTTEEQCLKSLDEYLIQLKPLSKIMGYSIFFGNKFIVNNDVFSPRSETEILVEQVCNYCINKSNLKVLDMCCGTGVIGISIATKIKNCDLYLVDISEVAVQNSKLNSKLLNCDARIIQSNLFENLHNQKFDVIVCNPPYIGYNEDIDNRVCKYDPLNALFADNNGYIVYEKILDNLDSVTNENYLLAFEIGHLQADTIVNMIKQRWDNVLIDVIQDYNKLDRVIILRKNF